MDARGLAASGQLRRTSTAFRALVRDVPWPVLRPAQVNLRGLHPLLRAEIQWGMFAYTQRAARPLGTG